MGDVILPPFSGAYKRFNVGYGECGYYAQNMRPSPAEPFTIDGGCVEVKTVPLLPDEAPQ